MQKQAIVVLHWCRLKGDDQVTCISNWPWSQMWSSAGVPEPLLDACVKCATWHFQVVCMSNWFSVFFALPIIMLTQLLVSILSGTLVVNVSL